MGNTRNTGYLQNTIKVSDAGAISFMSGSTMLATINTTGQMSGSAPVLSSSYASNAETLDGLDSTQFTLTSSFAAQTASFTAFTASVNSFTASQLVLNGTYATTGSNTFTGIQTINSNLVVTGSITAQTLVVQTITSSVDFVTGSTRFGSVIGNTHQFTGSVNITGSLSLNNITIPTSASLASTYLQLAGGTLSGALSGTSATFSGNLNLQGAVTRNINFYDSSNTNINAQIQYDQIASNSGQLFFGTNNAGTFATRLTIASTGAATFSSSVTASGRIHARTYGNASKGSFLMGIENDSESKWSYLCSTQYNSSANPSGYSVIGGYTSATENKVIIGGSIYEANPCTSIEFWAHTAVTHATGGTLRMRITPDGIKGAIYFDAQSSSGFRIRNVSDTANAGGWTRRGLWEGNANYDPALWAETGYGLYFYSNGSANIRALFDTSGHFVPGANNTYNLGSSSNAWANIYTNDLHLSNINKSEGNDIDGTSGTWTIQEGADDLYIINNLNNKKFKIQLQEII